MPLRTDLVSGAECDRVAWPHHAAAEAIGQGKERDNPTPRDPSQGCLDDPFTVDVLGGLGGSESYHYRQPVATAAQPPTTNILTVLPSQVSAGKGVNPCSRAATVNTTVE